MRSRRARIIGTICLAGLAATGEPKDVTLKLENVTIVEAVEQLAAHTGYDIKPMLHGRQTEKRISLALDRVLFWDAVERLCEVGDIRYMCWGSQGIRIGSGPRLQYPTHVTGPCHFAVTSISRTRDFSKGIDGPVHLSLSLTLMWEPELNVIGFSSSADLFAADMADGASLLIHPEGPIHVHSHASVHGRRGSVGVRLKTPEQAGGVLARLEGAVALAVATRIDEAVFENIVGAENVVAQAGEAEVKLESAQITGQQFTVRAAVTKPKEPHTPGPQIRREGRFVLVDDAGKEHGPRSSHGRGSRGVMSYEMTFRIEDHAPVKLIYRRPGEPETIDVDFEFTNLPLP